MNNPITYVDSTGRNADVAILAFEGVAAGVAAANFWNPAGWAAGAALLVGAIVYSEIEYAKAHPRPPIPQNYIIWEQIMIKHEFLLLKNAPEKFSLSSIKDYPRDEMTIISDDFILENHIPIRKVKMFWETLDNEEYGLNYYDATVINRSMAEELKRELQQYCETSEDLDKLVNLLEQAIANDMYIIHFGI
jgi:hypothetical protein